MFKYNMDQDRRDSFFDIIPDMYNDPSYKHYKGLDAEILKILLDEKFADPKERQNDAPTIQKFYDFMVRFPEFTAHGYLIGEPRLDYRISIEGLIGIPHDSEARDVFFRTFHNADEYDEFKDGSIRCWYD